jgi:VIT1/CCC1 family predicted Fe2+/Mn2+ transporter
MLEAELRPHRAEYAAFGEKLKAIGDDIWDRSMVFAALRSWAEAPHADSVWSSALKALSDISGKPTLSFAPALILDEELHLQPVEQKSLIRSAVIVTLATLIGHLIPLIPFTVATGTRAIIAAIPLSAVALFAVGVYSATSLIGDWRKSGL